MYIYIWKQILLILTTFNDTHLEYKIFTIIKSVNQTTYIFRDKKKQKKKFSTMAIDK